ncbi:MAG TPA: hypothetical protein VMR31_07355 [Myxococcota bacterium]|nr:hypothetical protein [Myxococcota bacterium]
MALLIAVIVLLLMSALGLAALQHAGDEATDSGRSRRKDSTLYAADSGIRMVQIELLQMINNPSQTSVSLDYPSLITDGFSNPIAMVSGAPNAGQMPVAQPIAPDLTQPPQTDDGNALSGGGVGGPMYQPVRADVTAEDVGNGMVHLQAQFKYYVGLGGNTYE